MKTLIILSFATFIIAQICISQDIIDPPKLFNKDTSAVITPTINSFIRSWNWGSPGRLLDQAMEMNAYHDFPIYVNGSADNMIMLQPILNQSRMPQWTQFVVRTDTCELNGMSIQFEPTLKVTDTSDNNFKPRWNDNSGSVFGFKYRNDSIGDTVSSGEDSPRFILRADRISGNPQIVLEEPYDAKHLNYLGYFKTNIHPGDSIYLPDINNQTDQRLFHPFNGKQWYLSINIRAINQSQLLNNLDSNILSIEMPFRLAVLDTSASPDTVSQYNYGQVKFDSLPNPNGQNMPIRGSFSNDFRGRYRTLINDDNLPNVINITGRMLQTNNDSCITLSAFAHFANIYTDPQNHIFWWNPPFKDEWFQNNYKIIEYIDSLNIKVTYHGKADVAIDWIRMETPNARKVFHGVYDARIKRSLDTLLAITARHPLSPKIHRFYAGDEFRPFQWQMNRYYNMLLDTLAASEIFVFDNGANRCNHATLFKEYWNGSNIRFFDKTAMPFIQYGNGSSPRFMYYLYGYKGNATNQLGDTLNSAYETFLDGHFQTLPITDSKVFEYNDIYYNGNQLYNANSGSLFNIENFFYDYYYKNSGLIYNKNPWWANIWVSAGTWRHDEGNNSLVLSNWDETPRTGEQIRLMTSAPVLLGSKGLIYWFKTTSGGLTEPDGLTLGLQSNNYTGNLTGEDLIYSNIIGGDYVNIANDPNGLNTGFNSNGYQWDSLGIDQNHIYIGIKSTTAELYKMHKWISAVEPELMNLRLQAWYGKGFIKMYSQHADIEADTLLKNYVDINNIKTRKLISLGLHQASEINDEVSYENQDSSFYDITLLKNINRSIDSIFYIGVQNRRTDPLIWDYNQATDSGRLRFFSSAEFDLGVQGVDSELWLDRWWKRLGCREITIPIYCNTISDYANVRVVELGAEDTSYNNAGNNFWTDSRLRHTIDTTFINGSDLILKMLPGEGKILRIELSGINNIGCEEIETEVLNIHKDSEGKCWYDLKVKNNSVYSLTGEVALIANTFSLNIPPGNNYIVSDTLPQNELNPFEITIVANGNVCKDTIQVDCPPDTACCDYFEYDFSTFGCYEYGYNVDVNVLGASDCWSKIRYIFHVPEEVVVINNPGVSGPLQSVTHYVENVYENPCFRVEVLDEHDSVICSIDTCMAIYRGTDPKIKQSDGVHYAFSAKAFPNPAKDMISLAVESEQKQWISIGIYDAGGNKIMTLDEKEIEQGSYLFDYSIKELASGPYILAIIRNHNDAEMIKLNVVK